MMNERVSTIMTTEVVTLSPDSTMEDAKNLFVSKGFHHIPIIEDDKLVGVITKSDLWKANILFDEYSKHTLRSLMTTIMVHLSSNEKIGVAAELFLENKFSYIPIVDGESLKGILSSFDIMMYSFKKEYPRQFD